MYCDPNPFTFLRAISDGRDNVQESRNNAWRGIETMNYFKRLVSKYAISLWTGALLAITIPIASFGAPSAENILNAVIQIDATVPGTARTANSLGTERRGSGIVIDSSGLVLTIGYLILEARDITLTDNSGHTVPAEIIAYDYRTALVCFAQGNPWVFNQFNSVTQALQTSATSSLPLVTVEVLSKCELQRNVNSRVTGNICWTTPSSQRLLSLTTQVLH
jgi:hypothetical protein